MQNFIGIRERNDLVSTVLALAEVTPLGYADWFLDPRNNQVVYYQYPTFGHSVFRIRARQLILVRGG
jgi:hypothetical protein